MNDDVDDFAYSVEEQFRWDGRWQGLLSGSSEARNEIVTETFAVKDWRPGANQNAPDRFGFETTVTGALPTSTHEHLKTNPEVGNMQDRPGAEVISPFMDNDRGLYRTEDRAMKAGLAMGKRIAEGRNTRTGKPLT